MVPLKGIAAYSNEPLSLSLNESEVEKVPNVQFEDPTFFADFNEGNSTDNYAQIERLLLNLALNHAVVAENPR